MNFLIPAICGALAFVVHESGHYIAAKVLGVKTYGFRLNGRGIGLARDYGSAVQNLAITLAGPVANFIAMGILFFVPFLRMFAIWFALMNFAAAVFNLLPIANSDGARAMVLVGIDKRFILGPRK